MYSISFELFVSVFKCWRVWQWTWVFIFPGSDSD